MKEYQKANIFVLAAVQPQLVPITYKHLHIQTQLWYTVYVFTYSFLQTYVHLHLL